MDESTAPILVPSSLANLRATLDDLLGTPSDFLFACAWSFSDFDPTRAALAEFDLPIPWSTVSERMAAFGGVQLVAGERDPGDAAYERLELGQPVVLAVDSHDLPFRPAYNRVHSARTLIATRIDRASGVVAVVDSWMPEYSGEIGIADLDRARRSDTPHDDALEPLYGGVPLERRWWTLALLDVGASYTADGALSILTTLAREALAAETSSCAGMASFRRRVRKLLSLSLSESRAARRAAALHLRAEIGLRAFLFALARRCARLSGESLLEAETEHWGKHLPALCVARDVLIKSVVFEKPEYACIVDGALDQALRYEGRFLSFLSVFCALEPLSEPIKGRAQC